MPPFVRPIRRRIPGLTRLHCSHGPPPYPLSYPQAGGHVMGLHMLAQPHSNAWRSAAHSDHDRPLVGGVRRQTLHLSPLHIAIRLRRFLRLWVASLAGLIPGGASHQRKPLRLMNTTAQDAAVIDAGPAMDLRAEGLHTRHLCVRQRDRLLIRRGSWHLQTLARDPQSMIPDPRKGDRHHPPPQAARRRRASSPRDGTER